MKNILIAGDSWGVGVFTGEGDLYGPTGHGIHTVLEQQEYKIINISKGGCCNGSILERISTVNLTNIDTIIFLQTDILREHHYYGKQYPTDTGTKWKVLKQEFVDSLLQYDTLQQYINEYFAKLYTKLNQLNKPILMVGGWSRLHPSIVNYSNLIPAVTSATKLLIPELTNDGYLSDPEWFIQFDKESAFMQKFNAEIKQMAIDNAVKLSLIYKHWNEVHPDINGYQKIAEQILAKIS